MTDALPEIAVIGAWTPMSWTASAPAGCPGAALVTIGARPGAVALIGLDAPGLRALARVCSEAAEALTPEAAA